MRKSVSISALSWRLLSLSVCLLCAVACEFEFDVRSHAKPGLYMQCIADANDGRLGFHLEYAAPAQGNTNDIPALSLSRFMVTLNGTSVEVAQDSAGYYSAASDMVLSAGAEIEVEVTADGLPSVSSSCSIPRLVAIDSLGHSRDTVMMLPIDIFNVVLEEQPSEGQFVAVRLIKETIEDGEITETKILTPMLGTGTDTETEVAQVMFSNGWIVENHSGDEVVTVAPASAFHDGTMVLPVMDFRSLFPAEDEEEETEHVVGYVYKVQVASVSESFYRYALACYKSNRDFMAMMGMAPANFAWSNVDGGFGVCAAVGIWSEAVSIPE